MKVSTATMIDGSTVDLAMDAGGVKFYMNQDSDRIFLCRNDSVFAVVELVAYHGEGGGGHLDVKRVTDAARGKDNG